MFMRAILTRGTNLFFLNEDGHKQKSQHGRYKGRLAAWQHGNYEFTREEEKIKND